MGRKHVGRAGLCRVAVCPSLQTVSWRADGESQVSSSQALPPRPCSLANAQRHRVPGARSRHPPSLGRQREKPALGLLERTLEAGMREGTL